MKKTLLLSTLISTALVGCGGGGGNSTSPSTANTPSNPTTPSKPTTKNPVDILKEAVNLNIEKNQAWYSYEVDTNHYLTHSNIYGPTKITFSDGVVRTFENMGALLPVYATSEKTYISSSLDQADDVARNYRIGKIKKQEVVTTKDDKGQDIVYLDITMVPYNGDVKNDSELTITYRFKVINLHKQSIAQTINPVEFAAVNNPILRNELAKEDDWKHIFKLVDKEGNFADVNFKEGSFCLNLESSRSNQRYFFAERESTIPTLLFRNYTDKHSINEKFNNSKGILYTVPDAVALQEGSRKSAIFLEDSTIDYKLYRYFEGEVIAAGEYNFDQVTRDNIDAIVKSYEENFQEPMTAEFAELLKLQKEHAPSECYLNEQAKSEAHSLLIKVNNQQY